MKLSYFAKLMLLVLLTLLSFAFALRFGGVDSASFEIIRDLRLPRVLLAFGVGASLSVAGVVLQAVFSNPLCEPYTLGVSSGAALGAVLGYALGWDFQAAGLTLSSCLGALFFSLVLLWVSYRPGAQGLLLLLSGVMLGFIGSSLVALSLALNSVDGLQNAMGWLFGDLSRARLAGSLGVSGVALLLLWILLRSARSLDAFLMGEEEARSLGVNVERERRKFIFLTSLLIAVGVGSSGMIGFIGLVVPHLGRKWVGALHRSLLPFSFILGGMLLVQADLLSRMVARPYELPVGVVTALLGAPGFLWVLLKQLRPAGER
jgi:iron complex transport system permease protein